MVQITRSTVRRACLSLIVLAGVLASSVWVTPPAPASAVSGEAGLIDDLLRLGPPALPLVPSDPLVLVPVPSRTDSQLSSLSVQSSPQRRGLMGWLAGLFHSRPAAAQTEACSSTTVDLQVLVITADPTDTQTVLPAIRQVLDYQGTPYTVFTASPRPGDPASNRLASLLSSGCHGYFEGVILGNGQVAYSDPTSGWQSALTDAEWQSLWAYERTFSIRQITWYTYPTAEYGFNPPSSGRDTTASPISAHYTGPGGGVFSYANTANPLTIQNVWAYQATPLDSSTTALLSDDSGNALGAVRTYPDGTQNLALTFDSNANVLHNLVLSYGLVNWVTQGLFLGERHIFLMPQVDDIFIDSHVWAEGTLCGSDTEQNNTLYRMTGDDLQAVIDWQESVRAASTTQAFWLDMVFNGEGTSGIFNPDTLTPAAVANEARFKWTNHTYTHANLDNTSYNTTYSEIVQNNQAAQQLGLTTYTTLSLVTPDISGLENPNAMQAMFDAGVRYVVSDASRAGYSNPSPNAGIYNQSQPAILMIPHYPNNLFYNVTNPQQWTEEYNCIYRSFWGRDLTYAEILDRESSVLLAYVLRGDMDPWMFHETNLRAYDGGHTLLGDLVDRLLAKYNSLFALPVVSPTMDDLGVRVAGRMNYNTAGVTASVVPGQSITISARQDVVVPVTGLNTSGSETYGGQFIAHVALSAGQTVTLSLNNNPPPTPTPTPIPTATPPRTPTPTPTPIPNRAPVASNDSYTMHGLDVVLIVSAPGVLGNDTDPDGDTLTAALVSGPTRGVLILNADGSFTYTPLVGLSSFTDSFTYRAFDGALYSDTVTVTIQVIVP